MKEYIKWIIISGIIFLLAGICFIDMYSEMKNYEFVHVGNGKIKVNKSIYNSSSIISGDSYIYLDNDLCRIIGIELPYDNIDDTVLINMGLQKEQLTSIYKIKNEYDLQKTFDVTDENILKMGHVEKPSFSSYLLRYKEGNTVVSVNCFLRGDLRLVEIIKNDEGDITEKELDEMYSGIGIYKNNRSVDIRN